ncbi:MAG: hypothetical protein EHM61_12810 [Acidobacteria bacterium]|nr:MAG: hypothetical protein EHM61_12810 [Acidobacteriota bacterium]
MKKRGWSRDMLEYLAARLACVILGVWPADPAVGFARAVAGPVLYTILREARRDGRKHLDLAFASTLGDSEKRLILRRMFSHLAQTSVEFFCWPPTAPSQFRMDNESSAVLRRVRHARIPPIFVTAHLGSWEVFGLTGGGVSLPVKTAARRLDNPRLEAWIKARREAGSQRMCPTRGCVTVLSRALRRGQPVVLLADQNQGRHGIFVNFFGIPASTTPTPALLSLRTGAPVVACCLVREGAPFRFRAFFAPPIYPDARRPREAEVLRITQEYTLILENWIRRYPEQWLWPHRRWRTRPTSSMILDTPLYAER